MSQSRKVLAVASAGGHWTQLLRLIPAFEGCEVVLVSTMVHPHDPRHRMISVPDANKDRKLSMLLLVASMFWLILRERPDFVLSTGAAPGYWALRFGRLFGARTMWVDSLANVDELSLSGRLVGRYAHLWLTQWPHLARSDGPAYAGAVL